MKENIIKRKLEGRIRKFMDRKEIIGIRGARQTGKTTLLKIIEEKVGGSRAFVNLDLADYRRSLEDNPMDFVGRFKKPGEKLFLLLDEIQRVRDGGEKLKIIFDEFPDVKCLFSGSSSLELKTKILPSLVGRLFLFELFTFNFEEFLSAKDEGLARLFRKKQASLKNFLEGKDDIVQPAFAGEFLKHWKEYAVFGGYPEVVKAGDIETKAAVLRNISSLYLEKDIMSFFKVEETPKFEDMLKALAFNISRMLQTSSLASDLKISHRKAEDFLAILQHTYIVHLLKPFHMNLVTELKKSTKTYFLDLGLRNSVIGNLSHFDSRPDRGELMENFVLRELVSDFTDWKLNYWRTSGKAEMDFVLSKEGHIIPIEVKMSGESLGRGFHSFLEAYTPERAIVVSLDKFRKQKLGKTIVYWVPVFYF